MMGYHIDKKGYLSVGSPCPSSSYTTVTGTSGAALYIAADRDNLVSLIEKYELYKETLDELIPELGKLLSHVKIF